MSHKQPFAISRDAQFAPCNVTEQEAFEFYRRLEKPTPGAVAQHFRQLGRKLSRSKVEKWAREGKWRAKLNVASGNSVTDRDTVLDDLARPSHHSIEEVKRGLAYFLLVRMARAIDHVRVESVKDLADLYNLASELVKYIARAGATQMNGETGAPDKVFRFEAFKPVNRGE